MKTQSSSGAAGALDFRTHTSQGWTAPVPATWKQTTSRKYGLEQHIGRWVFQSPHHNGVLRINIAVDKGGNFKALAEKNYQSLLRRLSEPKVHQSSISNEDGKVVSFRVLEGLMLRNAFMRKFTFARVFVRHPKRKLLVTVTLGLSDEKMDEAAFMKILETIMSGLKFVEPKTAVHLQSAPAAHPAPEQQA
jgi:2-methylaconitate cis-trans-isomerase PrpF